MSNRANQAIYRSRIQTIEQQQWVLVIANFYPSRRLQIINKLQAEAFLPSQYEFLPFNDDITRAIYAYKAIASTDTSQKGTRMTGYWIISNPNRQGKIN